MVIFKSNGPAINYVHDCSSLIARVDLVLQGLLTPTLSQSEHEIISSDMVISTKRHELVTK